MTVSRPFLMFQGRSLMAHANMAWRRDWTLEILMVLYLGASLLHFTLAPMNAHTHGMNFTIWFEVVVAAILLSFLLTTAYRRLAQFFRQSSKGRIYP